jgi:hypothetical protein
MDEPVGRKSGRDSKLPRQALTDQLAFGMRTSSEELLRMQEMMKSQYAGKGPPLIGSRDLARDIRDMNEPFEAMLGTVNNSCQHCLAAKQEFGSNVRRHKKI